MGRASLSLYKTVVAVMSGPARCGHDSGHLEYGTTVCDPASGVFERIGSIRRLPKDRQDSIFSAFGSFPQAIIIQQQRHITPTAHTPILNACMSTLRCHSASPLGLTVAGGGLHWNRTAGFRQRKFTMEQWGNSSFKVRLGSGAFSQ